MIAIVSALVLLASSPATASKAAHWGAEETLKGAPTPLAKAIEQHKDAADGTTVLVTAKAESVCQAKGCWVMLTDGDVKNVRVKMKNYSFFVPKDLAGKTLVIEGVLSKTTTSEKDARHYAEDAGASKEEIAKIKGDTKSWGLLASSIRVAE